MKRWSGNKYRAVKSTCNHGHTHDSKGEAQRCNDLHLLQDAGEISRLKDKPKFYFSINGVQLKHGNGQRVGLTADFEYFEGDKHIVEDFKGFVVRDWPLRKAVFCALYPYITLREVRK